MWRRLVVWVVVVALACGPVRRCEGGCDGVDGGLPAAPRPAPSGDRALDAALDEARKLGVPEVALGSADTELDINPRVRGLSPPPWSEEG